MAKADELGGGRERRKPTKFTRRPMERIHKIHTAIKDGRFPNCSTLAKELEVTTKTVQRDINFMRDSLKVPLCYDDKAHGYFYEDSVKDFPEFEVGAEEMAALFLARSALDSIRGTELADKLRDAFGKLTRSMSERVALNWSDLDEAFSRKVPEMKGRDVKLFGQMAEAVVQQLEIVFHYRKLGADKAVARRVQPLHLGEVDGGYYLIGMDKEREALRTFALPRMSRLTVSEIRFERPEGFDGREHLRRSFGVWSVDGDHKPFLVRVRLKGYAARLAQERRWHPTQEVIVLNGKGTKVDVCFEAGALEEVLRWVLSFGSKAKVIEPSELKSMVAEELALMSK
ncbi:helix-turn-helix transcriptional regulator [Haloferula sp.]|uniref:helix-turn-helix transcriptional regulator n=1 Tax=Haloferula sp. TaxID=2497595 RepID=UPI003C7403F1